MFHCPCYQTSRFIHQTKNINCNILHIPSPFGPNVLLSCLFSNILNLCFPWSGTEFLIHANQTDKTVNFKSVNSHLFLQVVCEKIFLGWTLSGTVIVPGLLMSQHTPSSLAALLRLCANPDTDLNSPRAAVSEDIKRRLYATLIEMEQALANDVV